MKQKYFLVCVLALLTTFAIACNKETEPQNQSTISVSGTGTAAADATVLPMGDLEITTNISVVFLLE